jgi:hypothetical protein
MGITRDGEGASMCVCSHTPGTLCLPLSSSSPTHVSRVNFTILQMINGGSERCSYSSEVTQ